MVHFAARVPREFLVGGLSLGACLLVLAAAAAPVAIAASCPSPTFGARTWFDTATGPEAVVSADFNGDGKKDVATANFQANSVSVLLGDGAGGFGAAANFATGGSGPTALAAGFIDGDANVDLVAANQASNNVSVLRGNGSGGFGAPATFATSNQPVSLAIADFNLDGKADIAFAALFNSAGVLDGDGAGGFAAPRTLITNGNPADVTVGDFNVDGAPDLAVPRISEAEIRILFNNGNGTFHDDRVALPPGAATEVAVADFNRDGRPDVAWNQGNQVGLAMVKSFTGGLGSPFETPVTFPVGNTPVDVAAGDVTGDGNPDIVSANRADDNVSVLAGTGSGALAGQTTFAAGDSPEAVAIDDFDADGAPDLAVPAAGESRLSLLKNACHIGPVDLQVVAMEVTQGVQDLANSVGLVADRRTVVRLHVKSNVPVPGVTARLMGPSGAPLWPSNPGADITVGTSPDRGRLGESFYFTLPPAWTTGTVSLTAAVNPSKNPIETSYTNNTAAVTRTFAVTKALKIKIVKYVYRDTANKTHEPTEDQVAYVESLLRRELPVSKLSITHGRFVDEGAPFDTTILLPSSTGGGDVGEMLRRLKAWRQTYEPTNNGEIYLGLVDDRGGGIAENIPGWNTVSQDLSAVHEVGHLLGRRHVSCTPQTNDEGGPDLLYPYPGGLIGGPANDTTRFYGFDVGDTGLKFPGLPRVVPNTAADTMSYCQNKWFSDYNYSKINTYINQNFTGVDPTGDFLSVYGKVDAAGEHASLSFLSRESQVGEIPPRTDGPFHIRLFDGGGAQLADYAFTPIPDLEGTAGASFGQIVDFVPGTRRVAIFSDAAGQEIASAAVSASAPTVSLTSPSGGTLPATGPVTVNWTAADPDGDPLRVSVLYSKDSGATWRTLVAGASGTSTTIDAAELEGTGTDPAGRLRVVASDGVLTDSSESGPLQVGDKKPNVTIHAPLNDSIWVRGQGIPLEATARDVEDGTLDGAAMSWSSDRDGVLGTGRTVQPAGLTPGSHLITVTATDSDGDTTSRSSTVHVVGKLPSGSVPAAYAGPDQRAVEGDTVTLDGTGSSDADGDALTLGWTQVEGPAVTLSGPASAPRFVGADDGTYTFLLTVTDGKQGASSDEVTVTIDNAAPKITIDSPTPDEVFKAGPVQVSAAFTDAGARDTHACRIVWDDENGTPPTLGAVDEAGPDMGRCSATKTLAAGVYTIRVILADDDGEIAEKTVVVIVYDPKAGAVIAIGAIDAPVGSYAARPALKGRATFVAMSAYPNGAAVPSGQTVLTFPAAPLLFHSTHQHWLAVSGFKAQYQGTGKINGTPGYRFRVTVADDRRPGLNGLDRFRIKIWNAATGAVVFDNVVGAPDTLTGASPQALAVGAVVILR